MKEKNKHLLGQAIEKLPVYEPPAAVWEQISGQLDQSGREAPLQEAIRRMRTYEPPDFVWERIQRTLQHEKNPSMKFRRLYLQIAASAAAVMLVAAVGVWRKIQPAPQIAYSVEEKMIQSNVVWTADWNADESLIDEVVALFENSPKANISPSYQTLRDELDELNEAKKELEGLMEKYGKDAGTIQELKEIELERSDIIKQMASLI